MNTTTRPKSGNAHPHCFSDTLKRPIFTEMLFNSFGGIHFDARTGYIALPRWGKLKRQSRQVCGSVGGGGGCVCVGGYHYFVK